MKSHLCAAMVGALAFTSGAAHAGDKVYAKAGITLAVRDADEAACREEARRSLSGQNVADGVAGGLGATLATTVGMGLYVGVMGAHMQLETARMQRYTLCMRGKGYVYARLTPKEQKAYDMMMDGPRRVWVDSFLRSERATEATRPLFPALPKVPEAPIEVIAGSATPAGAAIAPDAVAVKVKATVHAVRLKTPISYDGGKITVPAGQDFLPAIASIAEVISGNQYMHLPAAAWCAPAIVAKAKVQDRTLCLVGDADGYLVMFGKIDPDVDAVYLTAAGKADADRITTPLEFSAAPESESGPLDVRYELRRIGGNDFVFGLVTVSGRDYASPLLRFMGDKEGVIDVKAGEDVFRLTPTGKGKDRTFTVARLAGS